MDITKQTFRVALSFPGEHRAFVEKIAERLATILPREQIFYDNWYEPELAVPNLDTLLQDIYRKRAGLVVVFLCKEYEQKEWCRLEWRAVRDVLKQCDPHTIMPVRFDDTAISGLFFLDGYIEVKGRPPEAIADLILKRLQITPPPPPHKRRGWIFALAALLVLAAGWWLYVQPQIDRQWSAAGRLLSSGQYAAAAQQYLQIIQLEPWHRDAHLLRDIAELGRDMAMAEQPDANQTQLIGVRLAALLEQAPQNPHLLMLDGLRLYHQRDLRGAEKRYSEAIRYDLKLAEAYFNLGVLQADPEKAEKWFYKAKELAPDAVAYRAAHAATALERGQYIEAINEYASIPQYPLAKLEAAKAHWATGGLRQAEQLQQAAWDDLADDKTNALPPNQYPWDFDIADGQTVSLRSTGCKRYYAQLALTATGHFLGQTTALPAVPGLLCYQRIEIRQAVAEDLRRYALVKPEQKAAAEDLMARLLAQ